MFFRDPCYTQCRVHIGQSNNGLEIEPIRDVMISCKYM